MVNVDVTVYKDSFGLCATGNLVSVSSASQPIRIERIYLSDAPVVCGENLPDYKDLLLILDPAKGQLWIDETEASWYELIGEATGNSPDKTYSKDLIVGDLGIYGVPAGNVITFPSAVPDIQSLLSISIDGINIAESKYTFTSPRILDLTVYGGVVDTQVIKIIGNQ